MRRLEAAVATFIAAALIAALAGCAGTPPRGESPQARPSPRAAHDPLVMRSVQASQQLLAQGRLDEAFEAAEDAVRRGGRDGRARIARAEVLEAKERGDDAAADFRRAAALSPGDGVVQNAYGAWLCRSGQVDEALEAFTQAIGDEAYAAPEQALSNAGTCAAGAGRIETAEANFRAALGLAPRHPQSLVGLAALELQKGNALGARAFLQRREALAPLGAGELALAVRIEELAGDDRAAERYRQQLARAALPAAASPRPNEGSTQ